MPLIKAAKALYIEAVVHSLHILTGGGSEIFVATASLGQTDSVRPATTLSHSYETVLAKCLAQG